MKRITRITTQKKKLNRYNIFWDDGNGETYGLSVDEDVLIHNQLHKGMELDEALIELLQEKDTLQKSYTQAIHFLSYRMRTKKEIRDYLVKKEAEPSHIDMILTKLEKEGYVDDRQFAEAFVATRMQTSNKGPQLIEQELLQKGVPPAIAAEAVAVFSVELQREKAMKWADKKLRPNERKSYRQQLQQLQSTLMQKGFSQAVIKEVIAEKQVQQDEDTEWKAVVHQGEKLLQKHARKHTGFELQQKLKEALYRKGFSMDYIVKFLDEYVK
ncbi:recombination regulator RecX [Virgibacillus sp. LDC-1]|uniref:recombination regulator RecX n=1 Tax=Virgibacillus sp. LDC-1 TaxID=3039856 RepID=UPI0024DEE367|nr:recombination regulator RecX [Virgibacillus sp. LDC-1]